MFYLFKNDVDVDIDTVDDIGMVVQLPRKLDRRLPILALNRTLLRVALQGYMLLELDLLLRKLYLFLLHSLKSNIFILLYCIVLH